MSSTLGYSELCSDNDNMFTSENLLEKKREEMAVRSRNNATRKRREGFSGQKVTSELLQNLHNKDNDDDDDTADAFSLPQSAANERLGNERLGNERLGNERLGNERLGNEEEEKKTKEKTKENMINMTSKNDLMFRTIGNAPQPLYEGETQLQLNDYSNYGDEKSNEEYYRKILPGYQGQIQIKNVNNKPYYNEVNYKIPASSEENILLQKMNYMITLLEDQQDERTNNVTEEVILYSFLGIFIIFVADTFVRAGKYVR
jgi:hypothetical protein